MTSPPPGEFSGPVAVRSCSGVDWEHLDDLAYTALDGRTWVAPAGTRTDFASIPRFTAWLVARTGRWARAAAIHDQLYRADVPAGRLDHRAADAVFLEMLRIEGVAPLLRALMWAAVRWSALVRGPAARRGLMRDMPAVLPLTVLALLLVTAPTVVIIPALAVYAVVELLIVAGEWCVSAPDRCINPPRDLVHT